MQLSCLVPLSAFFRLNTKSAMLGVYLLETRKMAPQHLSEHRGDVCRSRGRVLSASSPPGQGMEQGRQPGLLGRAPWETELPAFHLSSHFLNALVFKDSKQKKCMSFSKLIETLVRKPNVFGSVQ